MIYFFDCDETLWESDSRDYVSSKPGKVIAIDQDSFKREGDETIFRIKPGARELLSQLYSQGFSIGIISDNNKEPVIAALHSLNLWKYVNPELVSVSLWEGYCPKADLIEGLLSVNAPGEVIWFDDRDYSREAEEKGYRFVHVAAGDNIFELAKNL